MVNNEQSTSLQATVIVLTMLCVGLGAGTWQGYSEARQANARTEALVAALSGKSQPTPVFEKVEIPPAPDKRHSLGDAIIVASIAGAIFGYFYLKYRFRQERMAILHQERMTALANDMALPDLDPPEVYSPPNPHVPLIIGIVLTMFGVGSMVALSKVLVDDAQRFWIMPLPIALIGVGLVLAYTLTTKSEYPHK